MHSSVWHDKNLCGTNSCDLRLTCIIRINKSHVENLLLYSTVVIIILHVWLSSTVSHWSPHASCIYIHVLVFHFLHIVVCPPTSPASSYWLYSSSMATSCCIIMQNHMQYVWIFGRPLRVCYIYIYIKFATIYCVQRFGGSDYPPRSPPNSNSTPQKLTI